MTNQNLGETLRELRNHKGITQDVVSQELNIARQTYCNYEIGKRIPDLDMLCKIAKYFSVTLDQLVITGIHPDPSTIDPFASLPSDYQQVMRDYHLLSPKKQQRVKEYIEFMKNLKETD